MMSLQETLPRTPVCHECDLVVVGGSCTGVFAAVRAARLGLSVAIVEAHNCFGGVATNASVNIWHNLLDFHFERPIIAGLTQEVIERLRLRKAEQFVPRSHSRAHLLNTEELKIVLDELVVEHRIRPFLHARFAAPIHDEEGKLSAIAIEDQNGRRAIRAQVFIDASGDGVLVHRAGFHCRMDDAVQPPTTCAKIQGLSALKSARPDLDLKKAVFDRGKHPEAIDDGYVWFAPIPGTADTTLFAGTRIRGCNVADSDQLTTAEIAGREQVRRICDILRREAGELPVGLIDIASHIGSRESRHATCLLQLRGEELLYGENFDDAIGAGTYPVDIHNPEGGGILFRYLDGRERGVGPGGKHEGRWREEGECPDRYQIPLRSLIPRGSENVLVAGRCLDADRIAFGAIRVMVNCNQMGEAAGVSAVVHLRDKTPMTAINHRKVRHLLAEGGSIIPEPVPA